MKKLKVCIVGGSGFVGSALVNRLSRLKCQVKVFSRHPQRSKHLKLLPGVSIQNIDYFAPKLLERQFDAVDLVINLAGILKPVAADTFNKVHVELARRIAEAASAVAVPRLLHMSALNAGNTASQYLLSKGQGQQVVHQYPNTRVTVFCPSVIFGPHDNFFNLFARLLRMPGPLPLVGAEAKFAPIYVEDVVDAFIHAIDSEETFGKNYHLCGPRQYTLLQLVEYTRDLLQQQKTIIPLGHTLSSVLVNLMGLIPGSPITRDNYKSMQVDSICQQPIDPALGIQPRSIESVLPLYLGPLEKNTRYNTWRAQANR